MWWKWTGEQLPFGGLTTWTSCYTRTLATLLRHWSNWVVFMTTSSFSVFLWHLKGTCLCACVKMILMLFTYFLLCKHVTLGVTRSCRCVRDHLFHVSLRVWFWYFSTFDGKDSQSAGFPGNLNSWHVIVVAVVNKYVRCVHMTMAWSQIYINILYWYV